MRLLFGHSAGSSVLCCGEYTIVAVHFPHTPPLLLSCSPLSDALEVKFLDNTSLHYSSLCAVAVGTFDKLKVWLRKLLERTVACLRYCSSGFGCSSFPLEIVAVCACLHACA